MAPKPPKRAETVAEAAYAADQTRLEKKRAELQDAIAVALDSENWELRVMIFFKKLETPDAADRSVSSSQYRRTNFQIIS